METRSKAQRDAVEADASGSGCVRRDRDSVGSRPKSSRLFACRISGHTSQSQDDAEQHQEHADLRHGPEISTLAQNITFSEIFSSVDHRHLLDCSNG